MENLNDQTKYTKNNSRSTMSDILIIRKPYDTKELELMYDLRWRILFKPWIQDKNLIKDKLEKESNHFIAILNNNIVGTARFYKINDRIAQIKYMAVDELFQRKGIGHNILSSIHMTARNQRIRYIILNSRENAIKFFEKHGYTVVEDGPIQFGKIKLIKMKKRL